jgi:hypothetical protein
MGYPSSTCFGRTSGKPLQTYDHEAEAAHQADYSRGVFKTELHPYRCRGCSKWHLAPAESHTPSVTCNWCTGRDGRSKELYPSEEVALRRAQIIEERTSVRLRAYECPRDEGWHLTSK